MVGMPFLPSANDPMDPNLFAIKWDVVFEVLAGIVLLSFILERALALFFESRLFVDMERRRNRDGKGTYKPLIAFILGALGDTGRPFSGTPCAEQHG